MKKVLLILTLFLSIAVTAQVFISNASYKYQQINNFSTVLKNSHYSIQAPINFMGKNAMKVVLDSAVNGSPCPSKVDTSFIYTSNDSVFLFENGSWQLFINFNASIGDSISLLFEHSNGSSTVNVPVKFKIDSVGIMILNSDTLRSLYLKSQLNNFSFFDFHDGWITEKIGHQYAFFPWVISNCAHASHYDYGLLEYSDTVVGNLNISNRYSDSIIITSTLKIITNNSKLIGYPNPTTGIVNIPYSEGLKRVEVFGNSGKLLSTSTPLSMTTTLELPEPNGIYILKFYMKSGEVKSAKIIKTD